MNFIKTIILSSILISFTNGELQQRPILFIHGFGDSCTSVERNYKFRDFVCIESGAGTDSWRYLTTQIYKACENINDFIESQREHKDIEKIGFYLTGFSQGGLIARGVFHECTKLRPLIKGIITIGTPNLGIDEIPPIMKDEPDDTYLQSGFNYITNYYFDRVSNEKWVPLKIGPLEYVNHFNSVPDTSEDIIKFTEFDSAMPAYKKYLNFNEAIKDPQNDGNVLLKTPNTYLSKLNAEIDIDYYDNLDLMINFTFLEDEMINPIPSQTFGAIFNEDEDKVQKFRDTQAYNKNWMGLKTLYDKSKLINCAIKGSHFSFGPTNFKNLILILSVEKCNQISEDIPLYTDYNECLEYMLGKYPFLEAYKCDRAPVKNINTVYSSNTNSARFNNSQNFEHTASPFSIQSNGEGPKIDI